MASHRKIIFRADASLKIGTGHVMRCLALAGALRIAGEECEFICRAHRGNLIEDIESKGYRVHVLPSVTDDEAMHLPGVGGEKSGDQDQAAGYGHWLETSQQQDAAGCSLILRDLQVGWIIVDHYALDYQWEAIVRPYCCKLMVIDDLASRIHTCDLLLDQNLGRDTADYVRLVPQHCRVIVGPKYALLRPEFAALREYSLRRRAEWEFGQLLISMGGIDKDNATGQVMNILRDCALPANCRINVVMGVHAPWLTYIQKAAADMPWTTEVAVNVTDMAQRMADSDLSIGAAGSTSWERCCLGLPTLLVVLAENQWVGAKALQALGAARLIGGIEHSSDWKSDGLCLAIQGSALCEMSGRAKTVTDGRGAMHVSSLLVSLCQ